MQRRNSRRLEKIQSKATDTSKQTDSLKKFQKQLYNLGEKLESSQLPNQSHKNIGDLIKEKQEEKTDFEKTFSKLKKDIERAKQELNKILPKKGDLSYIESSINKQLKVIEKYPDLMNLLLEDMNVLKKEEKFIQDEKAFHMQSLLTNMDIKNKNFTFLKIIYDGIITLEQCGRDISAGVKHLEPTELTTIESYKKLRNKCVPTKEKFKQFSKNMIKFGDLARKLYFRNSNFEQIVSIAQKRTTKDDLDKIIQEIEYQQEKVLNVFQEEKAKFEEAIHKDDPDTIKKTYLDNMMAHEEYKKDIASTLQIFDKTVTSNDHPAINEAYETLKAHQDYTKSTLQILNQAYLKQLHSHQNSGQMSELKESTLEAFQSSCKTYEEYLQSRLQDLKEQSQELSKPVKDEDKILEEATASLRTYINSIDKRIGEYFVNISNFISFYDLIEKNITHRLSNSLDGLEKKSQEALHLLADEIQDLHSQRQSEQSDQPQAEVEKPSPADKLQTYLEALFKDADMTDQCNYIVTSYMHGLFEKSHHQSLDDKTITNFYEKNIKEAKQVGEYIEQKRFISDKIRDDAIQFAVHLKQTFGFPIHDATIDQDSNIIKSDLSKDGSSSTPRLDIDRQGRILKDSRVQRVYLIGFQDSSEASSSHTQPKPKALLAIQSADAGYLKYGAGTPLPIGGVVDVVTAQYTTRDQPNLYQATLAIEALQETHVQKEVDMQTLELFETETVKNPHTKASLYDVTTFVGRVKDRPHQATPHDSKEYRETTGPCMVDLDKLIPAVKDVVKSSGNFCPSPRAMRYIKRQIARQVLGEEKVPRSDEGWRKNDEKIHWADFHEYSTSMNMFAKYLVLAYREELGLVGNR